MIKQKLELIIESYNLNGYKVRRAQDNFFNFTLKVLKRNIEYNSQEARDFYALQQTKHIFIDTKIMKMFKTP